MGREDSELGDLDRHALLDLETPCDPCSFQALTLGAVWRLAYQRKSAVQFGSGVFKLLMGTEKGNSDSGSPDWMKTIGRFYSLGPNFRLGGIIAAAPGEYYSFSD